MCLCAGKGDVAALGGLFGNGWNGVGCGGFGRQVFEDALDQLLCLFAVEVADDGDDGVVFAVVGAVEARMSSRLTRLRLSTVMFAPLP